MLNKTGKPCLQTNYIQQTFPDPQYVAYITRLRYVPILLDDFMPSMLRQMPFIAYEGRHNEDMSSLQNPGFIFTGLQPLELEIGVRVNHARTGSFTLAALETFPRSEMSSLNKRDTVKVRVKVGIKLSTITTCN